MNVWHIVTAEYPPAVGGVSDYTKQVAEGLAQTGDEVHVWCPGVTDGRQVSGVRIYPALGAVRPVDLRRLDALLRPFPAPRRLLVQWVPHGFGYHSMNLWFCFWLAKRAWLGDHVELMVHEPYLEFGRGPVRHLLMACVHRLMTVTLLGAARRVWLAIPAWEKRLRPYALGRRMPMAWLPVPGCVTSAAPAPTAAIRQRYSDDQPLIGHFGSFGPAVTSLLEQCLPEVMDDQARPSLLLLGSGSERFREALLARHPSWSRRVHAAGYVPAADLGSHLAACDLFLQPYPDGITSRRTSTMACLSLGRPVVTTRGHLTEPLWAETGAVLLAEVGDPASFALAVSGLLRDREAQLALGARGQRVCSERFSVHRVIEALRAA